MGWAVGTGVSMVAGLAYEGTEVKLASKALGFLVKNMTFLTLEILRKIFLEVIEGRKTFEEVSEWASQMIQKDEEGTLEFLPNEDLSEIFSALTYLTGLDLTGPDGEYFHSIPNVVDEYHEIFDE